MGHKNLEAVWLQVDLDLEWHRDQEQQRWWSQVRSRSTKDVCLKVVRGAGRVDPAAAAVAATGRQAASFFKDKADRGKMIVAYERAASIYRQLSIMHEDLHPILGYGVDGKTFTVVQQAAPSCRGLRTLPFSPKLCQRVLGYALKALVHLHEQLLPHGHISPESLLVENGVWGGVVRLAWAPGQRRPEGHASATLGFRGPGGSPAGPPGDIWGLACVILAWWTGFSPAPHPWTQFTGSRRLQQDIHAALAEEPPQVPKALLDLHAAAALVEDPENDLISLLASLLTRCLVWQPSARPTAASLLQDRFFEQAL